MDDNPRTRDKGRTLRPHESMEVPEFTRVLGEMVCELCGRKYWRHPHAMEFLDWQGNPYLRVLCSRDPFERKLVKL